jgi:hypothetical protein
MIGFNCRVVNFVSNDVGGTMRAISVALFVTMFLFCSYLSGNVEAYLDPGTGSMALQLLVGGVVAVLATVKIYWARLKSFSTRKRTGSD